MNFEIFLIAVPAIALLVIGLLVWRVLRRRSSIGRGASRGGVVEVRHEFPAQGLLVSDEVLRAAGSSSVAIWQALEDAATPIAIEYLPITDAEITKYHTLPVNATAQQSLTEVVKLLNPKNPTLFRVLLPKGEKLIEAAGQAGLYRGWAHNGAHISAQALLKPVAVGGAIAAGWPVFAVAGAVMVVDMVAQREQRTHQRKLEMILGRQEERYYMGRIAAQKTADKQLSRTINLMLDGRDPHMELALKGSLDEFHSAQEFLQKYRGVIEKLTDAAGMVDYRVLDETLGGKTKDVDYFIRELHLARAAIAIRRKALIADAAAVALADPANPYAALRRQFEQEARELEAAEGAAEELTERLQSIELKGRWQDRITGRVYKDKSVAARQARLRAQVTPAPVEGETELLYTVNSSGELLQLVPLDEDDVPSSSPAE
ncbi:hypothetical protein [Agromyces italicus]|uniref:hypothetical protein n=1 Tax=Agromyces italicus TaxID=279572 RepID=UPI0003B2FED9|nr:hypothetical protein [Agromyces italicus]